MSTPCGTYVVPVFQEDPCNGEMVASSCVVDSSIYSELGLSANSTQQQINQALYLAFLNMKATAENLQTQIDALS